MQKRRSFVLSDTLIVFAAKKFPHCVRYPLSDLIKFIITEILNK